MSSLSTIRRIGFRLCDAIHGSTITTHLDDLKDCFSSVEQLHATRETRLKVLLEQSCSTTQFYKPFKGSINLSDFPVIEKGTISENYQSFLSSSFDHNSLVSVRTSGSYGTPFTFLLSKDKRARQLAEIIYFSRWAGYEIGMKHASVRAQQKSWLKCLLQNQILMEPMCLDNSWLEEQRQNLKRKKIQMLIGYGTSIASIGRYCYSKGDKAENFALKGVIFSGEAIDKETYNIIKEVFGCPVLSRYAASELGVLAQECPACNKHHINTASYVIEILSLNSNLPVGPGELGRVVVTDLFSHAMPLIRYDTGDLAVLSNLGCKCSIPGPILESLEGRIVDVIFDASGQRVDWLEFTEGVEGIIQFQFIQIGQKAYLVKLCVLPSFNKESVIWSRLKKILGNDARIHIEYVSSIEPLPSGKRPYIINRHFKVW